MSESTTSVQNSGTKKESPKLGTQIACSLYQWDTLQEIKNRRIFLRGGINSFDNEDFPVDDKMNVGEVVRQILVFNREDRNLPSASRKPIVLYINSPGGDVYEGWPLISTIRLSKTPVYTVNIGMWASMGFLIGISGHKRFSLPNMMFLMHDGSDFMYGSSGKVQDEAKFRAEYEENVIKKHVLELSKMRDSEYDLLSRVEYYMLPDKALSHGFIDEIITDLDSIL